MLARIRAYFTLNNVILLVAFLLAISWMWGTMEALQKNFTLQQKVNQMKTEVELLDLEAQTLEFQQKYFQSDEYLELAAREHLGKAAPGEKVIILPKNTANDSQYREARASTTAATPPSNFHQWMTFFFGEKAKN
jgi:cell division protein FtsB